MAQYTVPIVCNAVRYYEGSWNNPTNVYTETTDTYMRTADRLIQNGCEYFMFRWTPAKIQEYIPLNANINSIECVIVAKTEKKNYGNLYQPGSTATSSSMGRYDYTINTKLANSGDLRYITDKPDQEFYTSWTECKSGSLNVSNDLITNGFSFFTNIYNRNVWVQYLYVAYAKLIVTYTVPDYTITANSNNSAYGTATINGASSVTIESNSTVTLKAVPNVGHKFVKWSNDGNTNATRTITVTENKTYTAIFEPITYSVVFSGNSTVSHSFNTAYTLPSMSALTRTVNLINDGNTSSLVSTSNFLGWHDENSIVYSGTTYSYPTFSAPAYYNKYGDLIANIDGNKYNKYAGVAHYHNNGKSEGRDCSATNGAGDYYLVKYQVKNLTTTDKATITLTPYYGGYSSVTIPIPTKAGYKFLGWYDENNNLVSSGGEYTPVSDISLYAKWEKEVILSDFRITEAFMLKNDNEIISASSPIIAGQGFILKVKAEIE